MSTKKQTYVGISERLNQLVDEISPGSAKKFATSVGVGSVTFYNYLKGRIPPADVLGNICEKHNVNLNWLVLGIEPKYITPQGEAHALDPDPEIAGLMEGARRVLTSGNPIAFDALERNIRYFDHAINAEKQLNEMKDDMEFIKKEFAKLKIENQRLDEEEEAQSSDEKAA